MKVFTEPGHCKSEGLCRGKPEGREILCCEVGKKIIKSGK